jgi:hypothetical protein
MGNQLDNSQATTESNSPLNTAQAASLFADILEPKEPVQAEPAEPKEPEAEPKPETAEPEPQEVDPEAPTEAEDPLVTVKIDGKEVEIPLSELKNGYQRQADYTRKTMEVSAERKEADAQKQAAVQERQTYAQNLQRMQAQIEGALQEQQGINWQNLLETDPQQYLQQKHLLEQRQAALQQNYAAQKQVGEQMQAEQAQRFQDHLKAQQEEILAKLPEWKDEAKAKAEKTAIRDYLLAQGFEEQNVNSVADAKAVLMARKAMLYDQMISKAQAAQKKVAAAPPKVERPGTGANPGLDKRSSSFQKLAKSGRVEDAAAVFASFL